jgi:hypothetical protein
MTELTRGTNDTRLKVVRLVTTQPDNASGGAMVMRMKDPSRRGYLTVAVSGELGVYRAGLVGRAHRDSWLTPGDLVLIQAPSGRRPTIVAVWRRPAESMPLRR